MLPGISPKRNETRHLCCARSNMHPNTIYHYHSGYCMCHHGKWRSIYLGGVRSFRRPGVHLFQPLSEKLVPGGPVLGGSIFVVAGQRLQMFTVDMSPLALCPQYKCKVASNSLSDSKRARTQSLITYKCSELHTPGPDATRGVVWI